MFTNRFLVLSIAFFAALTASCSRDSAKDNLDRARTEAERRYGDTEKLIAEWKPVLVSAAKDIKNEMDKVLPEESDWDFIVEPPEEGKDRLKAFDDKLVQLDRVKVGDVTVAYEQSEARTVAGQRYEKHFRARWISADRVYCVSCCSKKAVDLAAFLDLVQRLVPVTNDVLKHVAISRGKKT